MEVKFQTEQTPHLHSGKTTHKFMFDFKCAIYPLAVLSVIMQVLYVLLRLDGSVLDAVRVGLQATGVLLVGALSAMIAEAIWWHYVGAKRYQGFAGWFRMNSVNVPAISGILFALTLPVATPLYIVFLGAVVAIIIGKDVYGGLGKNIFNPALVGRAFVGLSFGGALTTSYPARLVKSGIDAVTAASPLSNKGITNDGILKFYEFKDAFSLKDLLLGLHPGAMGEILSLFIIIAFIFLVYKKVISWYVPTIYVGLVFVMAWVVGIMNGLAGTSGLETLGLYFPIYHVLSGGLLFGAVFMLTEPVTTPVTPRGRVIFAVYAAIITFAIRFLGSNPEGVLYSILFMNMFTPIIDDSLGGQDRGFTWKEIIFWVLTVLAVLGITLYVGTQLGGSL